MADATTDFNPMGFWGGGSNYGQINPATSRMAPGAGAYGLPKGFDFWDAGARSTVPAVGEYLEGTQGIADYFKGEMGKDYQGLLFGQSKKQIDTGFQDMGRQRKEGMTRAGMTGSGVSPLVTMQLEQEAAARSGALGTAAQMAVLQAQQYKQQAAGGLQNIMASRMQAMMAPGRMQTAATSGTPVGSAGPSLWGPALSGLGGLLSAAGGVGGSS